MSTIHKWSNGDAYGLVRGIIDLNFENLNSDKLEAPQVLTRTNTTPFVPTLDYHPVTKQYADQLRTNWDSVFNPDGIEANVFDRANHTGVMPASGVTQDENNRFVSDSQIVSWDSKEPFLGPKGTAFNKNFGTQSNEVAEGNHQHSPDQVGLSNVDNTSDLNKPVSTAQQDAIDAAISVSNALSWKNKWTAQQYEKSSVVIDDSWLMVANKQTTDKAAPIPMGDPSYLYKGVGMVSQQTTAKQIVFGTRYIADQGFWFSGYKVKVVAGNHYEIIAVFDPDGANEVQFLNGFIADSSGWRTFGSIPKPKVSGTDFQILAICKEPDPSPVEVTANYFYTTPENVSPPQQGYCVQGRSEPSILFIHHTDNDGIDRSSEFSLMQPGDGITLGTTKWSIQTVLDKGSYSEIVVAPSQLADVSTGQVHSFTLSTVVATAISYDSEPDYYISDPRIKGLFAEGDSWENVVENNNAYGIDIQVQSAYISPDWDFMAFSGNVEGGGGSSSLFPYLFNKETGFSTNLQTQQFVASIETPDLPAGTYEFAMSWTWEATQINSSVFFGFITENAGTIGPISEMRQEAKDATDKIQRYYSFPKDLAAGVKKLSFYAWTETSSNTVTIDFCDVIIKRVN